MNLKISRTAFVQYVFIFLLFYLNDSCLYAEYLSRVDVLVFLLCITMMLCKKILIDMRNVLFLTLMLISVILVRLFSGGIGFDVWVTWAVMILVSTIAIRYDIEQFLPRFVSFVYFMACISICIFLLGLIAPNVYRSFTLFSSVQFSKISHWYSSTNFIVTDYKEYGMLFYALRDFDLTRNNGVFKEPGLYQMILNTAYFFALFFKSKLCFENRKYKRILLIIILTIVTTQSTSGLLSLFITTIAFILSKGTTDRGSNRIHLKKYILLAFSACIVILGLDYAIRGVNSILHVAFLKKLFAGGSFSLDADTGYYRMVTVIGCIQALSKNPLGMGYDALSSFLRGVIQTEYVGAQILITFAAIGIIPAVMIIIWLFSPFVKGRYGLWVTASYVFMFINSALAQSKDFYPALVVVPIYLSVIGVRFIVKEEVIHNEHMGIASKRNPLTD